MIEARADVTLPVSAAAAFAVVSRLDDADWLPTVRRLRYLDGPREGGVGSRYEIEAGLLGRHLRGTLICREFEDSQRVVWVLEDGLELTVTATTRDVGGGCVLELEARYAVGGGPLGLAVERATVGPARREVARAVEQLASRFGRKSAIHEPA